VLGQSSSSSGDGQGEHGYIGEGQRVWKSGHESVFTGAVKLEGTVGSFVGHETSPIAELR